MPNPASVKSPSPGLLRVMALACVALFLAGVVAAVTSDDDADVTSDDLAAGESDDATSDESDDEPGDADTDDDPAAGGTADDVPAGDADTTTTSTTAGAGGTSTSTGDAAAGSSSTTTTTAGGATTTAPPSTAAPTSTAPPGTPAPRGTTPTAAGTYTYDVSGTVDGEPVNGTSTLEVPAADAEGRQAQLQRGPDGTTTTTYRFTPQGTYLEQLRLESEQGTFTLNATAPFLIVPAGAAPGTVTNGRLQGDGLTADVSFRIVDADPERTTVKLQANLSGKVSGFDVEGTIVSDIIARTADQLPLDTRSVTNLSAGGGIVTITSDIRSVLRQ